MPVNPMQRRVRNSFLGGFLIALLIMALIVVALIFKMKSMQEETNRLIAMQKNVLVAAEDLKSGDRITYDSFMMQKVQINIDPEQIVSEDDFSFFDKEGNIEEKYHQDGSIKQKEMIMKIDVPAGTVVTKDMIAETESDIANDLRLLEYNMIALPTELEAGDYIDIRYSLPQGQDYIVLAKKKAKKVTETGIWLELTEEELLTLNNAIVESYYVTGSLLRAVEYPNPGIQEAATPTYPVSTQVLELINNNPNIVETAKQAIYGRYYANNSAIWNQRLNVLDPTSAANAGNMNTDIESKIQEEISKIQQSREDYLSSLDLGI